MFIISIQKLITSMSITAVILMIFQLADCILNVNWFNSINFNDLSPVFYYTMLCSYTLKQTFFII